MDVRDGIRSIRRLWLAAGLALGLVGSAQADPIYNAIDLGTGPVTYGVDSGGNGTITGANGLTYTFNPAQNELPAQWSNTTQGVPTVEEAPTWDQFTYGNPNFAYSYSYLKFMNSGGLAAGIDYSGVSGHLGNGEAFFTQQHPDGSWGTPTALWSGSEDIGPANSYVGIAGVSKNGQVLGFGAENPYGASLVDMFVYDTKTQTLTNLTHLVNSMTWTNASQLPMDQSPNWLLNSYVGQIDDQGRILVQANEGFTVMPHYLLLVPQGTPSDLVAAPEPATWAVFTTLIGGWAACGRPRSRDRLKPWSRGRQGANPEYRRTEIGRGVQAAAGLGR